MARATWNGFLSFGLVSVPVGLFASTEDRSIHFNQFEKGTSDRIRYKKVNERTGEEVASENIVKGYDLGGDEYVIVTPEELKSVAPGQSEMIEIIDFVDLEDIDPVFFQKAYYLAPKGSGADKAYGLLRQAMRDKNKVGIATFVIRDKEYLVAVRPSDSVLMLETMYFADEVRDPVEELDTLPKAETFQDRELDVAKQLIEAMSNKWSPENYHSDYRQRVEDLIEQKRHGKTVVRDIERPQSNVINLMDALQASIEKSRGMRTETPAKVKAVAPTKVARSTSAKSGQQSFAGMSKDDLLARAVELDVKGRSKMTKEELIDAVKAADQSARRRTAS